VNAVEKVKTTLKWKPVTSVLGLMYAKDVSLSIRIRLLLKKPPMIPYLYSSKDMIYPKAL